MLIDTHCHLDAAEFAADRQVVLARARQQGVQCIVVPSVSPENFATVQALAKAERDVCYALGIHPCYSDNLPNDALAQLRAALEQSRDDPKLVAVGEIGLDFFIADFDAPKQERLYQAQLQLAHEFALPVLLHVRRSQDRLLKYLRTMPPIGGIAHAFNGSEQQANAFIAQGFALGFGGAFTYRRALQLRRLVSGLPSTAHVLETDAPDIAPEWIARQRNEPAELARIAATFVQLRGEHREQLIAQTASNARRVLPRLAAWLDHIA